MKKNCYQYKNYDWTKQKIKNRTTFIKRHRKEKKNILDFVRSLLF